MVEAGNSLASGGVTVGGVDLRRNRRGSARALSTWVRNSNYLKERNLVRHAVILVVIEVGRAEVVEARRAQSLREEEGVGSGAERRLIVMLLLISSVIAVASESHLNLDEKILALAETELANLDIDVRTCGRDDGTRRTRDFTDTEPAAFWNGDVQASVGSGDGEDSADAAGESVAKVV